MNSARPFTDLAIEAAQHTDKIGRLWMAVTDIADASVNITIAYRRGEPMPGLYEAIAAIRDRCNQELAAREPDTPRHWTPELIDACAHHDFKED